MEQKPTDYFSSLKYINEIVAEEMRSFGSYSSGTKIRKIASSISRYVENKNAANCYKSREKKNPERWKKERETSEYFEAIYSQRTIKRLQSLSKSELEYYLQMLELKLQDALNEKDIKKRYKKYDYVVAGCQLCRVEDKEISEKIEDLKARCSDIILDIPSM